MPTRHDALRPHAPVATFLLGSGRCAQEVGNEGTWRPPSCDRRVFVARQRCERCQCVCVCLYVRICIQYMYKKNSRASHPIVTRAVANNKPPCRVVSCGDGLRVRVEGVRVEG